MRSFIQKPTHKIVRDAIAVGLVVFTIVSTGMDADAQVRESTNYRIQSDSLNVGGTLSSSSNYTLEDTTGEIATGESGSSNYKLKAGYQQMQEVYLALQGGNDVTLSPALGGVTGGTSNGSTTVTAITDSPSGYELSIEASSSPAMQKGVDTIDDYTPAGDPDFAFSTGSADAHFGFSPEGSHIADRYKDNGADTCNTGSTDTALACWDGLSTTPQVIARSTSPNQPSGTDTKINFRVGIGGSVNQAPGIYTATTTVTLLAI